MPFKKVNAASPPPAEEAHGEQEKGQAPEVTWAASLSPDLPWAPELEYAVSVGT